MGKILLKGGTVLTVDPDIGDRTTGDVLIEDDTIVGVEASIEADAEVVDCTGKIVIPGFVDTHRHTWEAAIRNCAPNATLDDYFVEVLDTFAPLYRAEDVYASNLAGSLECLNAGITTLVDWSHINNTPDHPDAAISALKETGIRAQYAYGSANTSLEKYWFFSAEEIPGDDVRRILVSPDGGLAYVPFALLWPEKEVASLPSGTSWALLQDVRPRGSREVLAVGDPRTASALRLDPLPGAREEARALGTRTLLGQEATEARLREALVGTDALRALHLACHGRLDASRPGLSALLLTPDDADDGELSVTEDI